MATYRHRLADIADSKLAPQFKQLERGASVIVKHGNHRVISATLSRLAGKYEQRQCILTDPTLPESITVFVVTRLA